MPRLALCLVVLASTSWLSAGMAQAQSPCDPSQPGVISDADGDGEVTGTDGDDLICLVDAPARSTPYVVRPLAGDDVVFGGPPMNLDAGGGDDFIDPGSAISTLAGGAGRDTLSFAEFSSPNPDGLGVEVQENRYRFADATGFGGPGGAVLSFEPVIGSRFADRITIDWPRRDEELTGGDGDDRLVTGYGNDTLRGGPGKDRLEGWYGDDVLDGGSDADDVDAGFGNDTVHGGDGSDRVDAGFGDNEIFGEDGDDTLAAAFGNDLYLGGAGADAITDPGGRDTISYADHDTGVSVDLTDPLATHGSPGEGDSIQFGAIENVTGGDGPDKLTGTDIANVLVGGAGDDLIQGRGGADTLDGGAGGDDLRGGTERDVVLYADRSAPLDVSADGEADDGEAGEGDNVAIGVEDIVGGSAGDRLDAGPAASRLVGGDGDDTLIGRTGDDLLEPGRGADTVLGNDGEDEVSYAGRTEAVSVTIDALRNDGADGERDFVREDVENLTGGSGNDTLRGAGGPNVLDGGPGADTLAGGPGSDTASYARHDGGGVRVTLDGVRNDGDPSLPGGVSESDLIEPDVENATGTVHWDRLTGDAGANVLRGEAEGARTGGRDTLDGGGGPDRLIGGPDFDTVSYASRSENLVVDLDGVADDGSASDEASGERDLVADDVEEVDGGSGDDTLVAGADRGTALRGGDGDDTLIGGPHSDYVLDGDAGADVLDSGEGIEFVVGGPGRDTVTYARSPGPVVIKLPRASSCCAYGRAGGDLVRQVEHAIGSSGDDNFFGNEGVNRFEGGPGDDLIRGDDGADSLVGDEGDDRFVGGAGADGFDGGDGVDRVNYAASSTGVRVTMDGVADDGGRGENDNVRGDVENVIGSPFRDDLRGSAAANRFEGHEGNDLLAGGGGPDTLIGDGGIDTVSYADRTEPMVVTIGGGADDGAAGEGDEVTATVENVLGGSAGDRVTGTSGPNLFDGRDGNDVFDGGLGEDTFYGGGGQDRADYSARTAQVVVQLDTSRNDGESGERDFVRGSDVEDVVTGSGPDRIFASPLRNVLSSGAGDDIVYGLDGGDRSDSLLCGDGFDRFTADPADRPNAACERPL